MPFGILSRIRRGLAMGFAASGLGFFVSGQSGPANLTIDQELNWLQAEAVTVASLLEESPFDAPASVSVFTGSEIRDMGITSLEDLLNFVPGYHVTRNAEQGVMHQIGIRGRRRTEEASDVLFLIDGQRMNEPSGGSATFAAKLLSVDNIEQVEIIRGPGSALYGSNAFLGVVSIKTVRGVNNATVRGGTFAYRDLSVNFSDQLGDLGIHLFGRMFADDGDTFRNNVDSTGKFDDATRDPRDGFDVQSTFEFHDLSLTLRHQHRQFNDFFQLGALGDGINDESVDHSLARLAYHRQWDRLSLDFSGGLVWMQWESQAHLLPAGLPIAPGFTLAEDVLGGPLSDTYHYNFGSSCTRVGEFQQKSGFEPM